jgi:D-alanyl-D-alanine carboxypeptidase
MAQYFYTPQLLVPYIESAPEVHSRAVVLIDAATGELLYSKNPYE